MDVGQTQGAGSAHTFPLLFFLAFQTLLYSQKAMLPGGYGWIHAGTCVHCESIGHVTSPKEALRQAYSPLHFQLRWDPILATVSQRSIYLPFLLFPEGFTQIAQISTDN